MKLTRREIIKKGMAASILLAVPSVLLSVVKGLKEDDFDHASMLDGCINPDLIILDELSIDNIDFIALMYDKETMNAPMPVWGMNPDYNLCNRNDVNNILNSLRLYAIKNDVFIYSNREWEPYDNDLNLLINKIRKNCTKGSVPSEISEDLYRIVSVIYSDCYEHHQQLEARCGHKIEVGYR